MGCGSSSVVMPVHSFSLSGKNVKEISNLRCKTVISESGIVPVYFVKDSVVINQLNKEIAYRLKEASAIPKNQDSEFIDLRSAADFSKSHLHLFMNMDSSKEQVLSASDQTLKILFDFKNVFFLTDAKDQSSQVRANSMIQFGSQPSFDESGVMASASQKQSQQSIQISQRVKSVIKLFNSKSVKAKSYNIVHFDYAHFEANYPDYVVKDTQPMKQVVQSAAENSQEQQQAALVGENEIFQGTIFTQIQLPLFIYDHNDFIGSNDKGIKVSSSKPCQVYLQSLPQFQNNIKTREGKQFYTNNIKIQAICIGNSMINPIELQEINSVFPNVTPKSFLLKDNKEISILMMKQLHSNIEQGLNTLIIRENNKENFLEVITVFKALMYEKYQVFSTQIQEYLLNSVPKSVAYQLNTTLSMAVNVGDRAATQKNFAGDESNIQKVEKHLQSRCQQLSDLITPIFKSNKKSKDKSDNFVDVFAKLFENIIRNPNEDKFRIIKKENKIIKDAILNYKQSSQILTLCGFVDKGEIYQNQLTSSDITIIKGDFDLAIKNSLKEVYNQ